MKKYYKNELTTIYNGDCLNVMKGIIENEISIIITSPPYNIIRPNCTDRGYDQFQDSLMSNEEYANWIIDIFKEFDRILEVDGKILFNMSYGTENTEVMNYTVGKILEKTNFTLADVIVWKKQSATPNNVSHNKLTRIVEFIYVFCRENEINSFKTNKKVVSIRETGQKVYENIFNFINAPNNDGSTELNKATFSSALVHKLLDIYYVGGIALDCFSGTGTTSYACQQRNIKSIGIELSENQCSYTKKRLSKTQLSLL